MFIVNHAEDRVLFLDLTFVPLVERLAARLPSIERYVVLTDDAHMPETTLRNAVAYESWLAEADADFRWNDVVETDAAGLCYTSGTTGDPKGVLYFAPLERPARDDDGRAGRVRSLDARQRAARGAAVPRE